MYCKKYYSLLILILLMSSAANVNCLAQLKIMPLGNSITYDNKIGDTRPNPSPLRVAYRDRLYDLLDQAGYNFDFVGSENVGESTVPDGDNAGFPGITAAELATLLTTGIITQSTPFNYSNNDMVTTGPYLDAFNPDVILLHIGTNGVATTTASDVADILDEVDAYESRTSKNIPVFVARIIKEVPNNTATQTLNDAVETMVNTRIGTGDNLIMVDMETGAGLNYAISPAGDMVDMLHPETIGYEKMADLWFSKLGEYFVAPIINSTAILNAVVGQAYSYDVGASGVPAAAFSFNSTPPTGMTINANTGVISWNPSELQIGDHPISVLASNDIGQDIQNFALTVAIDNDAPTFTVGPDIVVDEDAGPQSNANWATAIDDGDPELTQNLNFNIINNSNTTLFSGLPAISSNGTLTFETAENENGVASITITLTDDGDGTPPNENTSFEKTFKITVNAVNDSPLLTNIVDQTTPKNTTLGPINFTISDPESLATALTVSVTSNNQLLISDGDLVIGGSGENRTLSLTPNINQSGDAVITLEVSDENLSHQVQFTLTVSNVTGLNDPVLANTITVFPNPHSNIVNVDFSKTLKENIEFVIYDVSGRQLLQDKIEAGEINRLKSISTKNLRSGLYFMKVNQGIKVAIKKIVKN